MVSVIGVNHLLVPAAAGDVSEHGSQDDQRLSPDVTTAVTGWLSKALAPKR